MSEPEPSRPAMPPERERSGGEYNLRINLDDREDELLGDLSFEALKAELERGFAAPDSSFMPLSADDVIARNRG